MGTWHTYTGTVEGQVYPQYLDAQTGRTLVAEPGHSYEIVPAVGHTVLNSDGELVAAELPMPTDTNWTSAPTVSAYAQPEPAPAVAPEPEPSPVEPGSSTPTHTEES